MPIIIARRNNLPIFNILEKMDSVHTEFHTWVHYLELVHVIVEPMASSTYQVPLQLLELVNQCNALFIYLIILVEFRFFYMTYMIYVDK